MLNPAEGTHAPAGALERLLAGRPITDIRPGLERVRAVLRTLDSPERAYASFHIAGTNGKGSTAAALAGLLRAGGHRVGLYTSPHLRHVSERIRLDGAPAPPALLDRCAERVAPPADRADATYFEALTCVAFLCFAEAGVERAVVETGLGGRLDATNVLRPAACGITSLSLDHARELGGTVREVAREKAGILKPGTPAAVARLRRSPREVVEARARALDVPVLRLGRDARVTGVRVEAEGTSFVYRRRGAPDWPLRIPLVGSHQADNAGLALLLLEAGGEALEESVAREALADVRWPGRFQLLRGPAGTWVLDVAHNPTAVAALDATLRSVRLPEPLVVVFSALRDKAWGRMLRALPAGVRTILTVAPSAPAERRWDPHAALAGLPDGLPAEAVPDFGRALERARELAGPGTVVVTGSFTAVGDALARLAWAEGSEGGEQAAGTRRNGRDT